MPPKKNKKPSRNGYWQFVLECRDKNPNKNMNMQEIQTYANRKWTNMSKEERQPYENMARLARNAYEPKKYTTDGFEIDEVKRKEKDLAERMREMRQDIERNLETSAVSGTLGSQHFLIIHINHLIYYPTDDRYFICEVGLAALSLQNGVEEVYHKVVKPGKLPLGFYGGALAHSKETHQLFELVQDEPYEDNTEEVFADIIRFMRKYSSHCRTFVLYADEKTQEMTTNVFENWRHDFNFEPEIKIYNFQYLFLALRNAVAGRIVWPNESFSFSEIEKDVYSYTPNIACEYHELSDILVYCSKSIVTRYGYTICDHCCYDLGIKLIPGWHVPEKSRIVTEYGSSSKDVSDYTTDHYRFFQKCPVDSFSSSGSYNDNFPHSGSTQSSASSIISFSSLQSGRRGPSGSKVATRIERSFKAIPINEARRDHSNLHFPPHGYERREN